MQDIIPQDEAKSCPLCLHSESERFFHHINSKNKVKTFHVCKDCTGVFRDPSQLLTPELEKKRYEEHVNSLEDERYLKYLSESLKIFKPYIQAGAIGLDFGCGPSKGFEFLSTNENFKILSWDKYFYPEKPFRDDFKFDFVICQEVIEHFTKPHQEFLLLLDLVKEGGDIFIRTEAYPKQTEQFLKWYYKDDPTHVFFYNTEVFKKIEDLMKIKSFELDHNKWRLQKNT